MNPVSALASPNSQARFPAACGEELQCFLKNKAKKQPIRDPTRSATRSYKLPIRPKVIKDWANSIRKPYENAIISTRNA